MQYEDQSRRAAILGGFALGIGFGVGVGMVLAGERGGGHGGAVSRARGLRAPSGRAPGSLRGGARARMARRRFRL